MRSIIFKQLSTSVSSSLIFASVSSAVHAEYFKSFIPLQIQIGTQVQYYSENKIIDVVKFSEAPALNRKGETWETYIDILKETDNEIDATYSFKVK
jgi:hypothetical protein